MVEKGVTRKLAAILAADVVGYSRLMSVDKAGTLARMTAHLDEIFKPAISEHQGHVVKTTGCWPSSPAPSKRSRAPCKSRHRWPNGPWTTPEACSYRNPYAIRLRASSTPPRKT